MSATIFESVSPEDTYSYGHKLAFYLNPGDIVCLSGDLGQGKTLFTKGIVAYFNPEEIVTSPTFSLLNIYSGKYAQGSLSIYHFDLYRLDYAEQLEDIGFNEYIYSDGINIIEWPDNFLNCLPQEYLWVQIIQGASAQSRQISLLAHGKRYEKLCGELNL